MPNERCIRCHTILTSEDKYWYSISCEECQCDLEWEEHEKKLAIKSAYWRWRAVCFGVRWLWNGSQAIGSICLQRVTRLLAASRSGVRHDRRR